MKPRRPIGRSLNSRFVHDPYAVSVAERLAVRVDLLRQNGEQVMKMLRDAVRRGVELAEIAVMIVDTRDPVLGELFSEVRSGFCREANTRTHFQTAIQLLPRSDVSTILSAYEAIEQVPRFPNTPYAISNTCSDSPDHVFVWCASHGGLTGVPVPIAEILRVGIDAAN